MTLLRSSITGIDLRLRRMPNKPGQKRYVEIPSRHLRHYPNQPLPPLLQPMLQTKPIHNPRLQRRRMRAQDPLIIPQTIPYRKAQVIVQCLCFLQLHIVFCLSFFPVLGVLIRSLPYVKQLQRCYPVDRNG